MKRALFILACLALLTPTVSWAQGATGVNIGRGPNYDPTFWSWRSPTNKGAGLRWMDQVEELLTASTSPGTGDIYYVDSNVSNAGDGSSWSNAKATLDAAINLCSADNGDIIYIAQGHTETMGAAADTVDIDVNGITIIGCGTGDNIPNFDYTSDVTGTFAIGADNITLYNIRFHANVTDVNEAIEVEAGSEDVTVAYCVFDLELEGTDDFLECIDTSGGAASDRLKVIGCEFRMGAGACNSAVCMKDSDYAYIAGNISHGDYAVANINQVTTASNHIVIENNVLFNGTIGGNTGLNAQPCIEVLATTTGVIANNALVCNVATPDAAIVGADMYLVGNVYSESEATSVAPMWLTTDTTDNILGFNDNNNAADTSNVASNVDGSMLERMEDLADMRPRCVSKSQSPIASATLFSVSGPVMVTEICGYVTGVIESQANAIKLFVDPCTPATDTDLCGTKDINALAAGTALTIDPNSADAMLSTANGVVTGAVMSGSDDLEGLQSVRRWLIPSSDIELNGADSNTGTIVWYIRYFPLVSGAKITAD